ncbi:MAG: hypothetical protein QNJ33_15425 [Crocosphaera sp.]|nr:hypothetical protein [Crocosphaera sp.]
MMINKGLSLFLLVPTFFCGINNLSTKAQIPQGSFQEIYIEGYSNQVTQQLNQTLNLNFIDLPEIESSVIPNVNIQGTFLDNPNNEVNQEINQNVFNSSLIPFNLTDLKINDFIGNDNTLNGLQFSEQQVFIQGNTNVSNQLSRQILTDFFLLEQSDGMTELEHLNQFLSELLESELLDSFQLTSQDTLLFGNNNIVNQSITQTVDIFIFLSSDLNSLFETDTWINETLLKPNQFTIQETFIDVSENNYVTQTINQSINNISLIKSSISSQENYLSSGFKNTNIDTTNWVEFPIDAFINEILNNTIIEGQQINSQFLEVVGNSNENIQKNEQILDLITNQELSEFTVNEQELLVSVPEPSNLRIMIVLLGIIGIRLVNKALTLLLLLTKLGLSFKLQGVSPDK